MKSIAEIRARREALIAAADNQREALAVDFAALKGPARLVGKGLNAIDWLRQNPLVIGIAAAILVVARPRKLFSLATRGVVLWRGLQSLRQLLDKAGVRS